MSLMTEIIAIIGTGSSAGAVLTWIAGSSIIGGNTVITASAIAYNGTNQYVAITASSSTALISTDAISWTTATMPAASAWQSIAYGNGRYIAITGSSTNIAASSTNGVNWSSLTLNVLTTYSNIIYAGSRFVLIGTGSGQVSTTTDGSSWTSASSGVVAAWNSIAYGNGRYVLVTDTLNSNGAAQSTNGVNWTTLGVGNMNSVAFGNGVFVTVAKQASYIYRSTDGITWTYYANALPSAGYNWNKVLFSNNIFLAIAFTDLGAGAVSNIATSTNGINWTAGTFPSNQNWNTNVATGTKFISLSKITGSSTAAITTDCITWTYSNPINSSSASNWSAINRVGNYFFALPVNVTDLAVISTDAISWKNIKLPMSATWNSVAYDGVGKYVAVSVSDTSGYSTDGISWTPSLMSDSATWKKVLFVNGRFIAIADGQSYLNYSINGVNWCKSIIAAQQWRDIATDGANKIVAVGTSDGSTYQTFAFSEDGKTWRAIGLPNTTTGKKIIYANNRFVVLGSGYGNYISTDGVNWDRNTYPPSLTCAATTFTGTKMVALFNSSNSYALSTDGLLWYQANVPGATWTTFGSNSRGEYIALSTNGLTAVSVDSGITWLLGSTIATTYKAVGYVNGRWIAMPSNTNYPYTPSSTDGLNWNPNTQASAITCQASTTNSTSMLVFAGTSIATTSTGKDWAYITTNVSGDTRRLGINPVSGQMITCAAGVQTRLYVSDNGKTWAPVTVPSGQYQCIAYGNGTWVALTETTVGIYSTDGYNWDTTTVTTGYKTNMVFGNYGGKDIFIASITSATTVIRSTNGINWQTSSSGSAWNWTTLIGGPKLVLISNSATYNFKVSTNGINWANQAITSSLSQSSGGLIYSAYAFGTYVACQTTGYTICSTDTITWVDSSYITANTASSLTASDTGFYISGWNVFSTNGLNWTSPTPSQTGMTTIAYGNNVYVMVKPNFIYYSTDIINWTSIYDGTNAWGAVAFGNGVFVAIITSASSNVTGVSTNGINWTTNTGIGTAASWTRPYFDVRSNSFIILAAGGTTARYSADGVTWYSFTYFGSNLATNSFHRTANADIALFTVATGNSSSIYYRNSTGFAGQFTAANLPVNSYWTGVTSNGSNRFVAVAGYTTDSITVSTNAVNWTIASNIGATQAGWAAVTYGNGVFVAVGGSSSGSQVQSSASAVSTDGNNWTFHGTMQGLKWTSVTYIASTKMFIAVASDSASVNYSYDGMKWFQLYAPGSLIYNPVHKWSIIGSNSDFIPASSESVYWWTKMSLPSATWSGVAYNGSRYVLVSTTTLAIYSDDGWRWNRASLPITATWSGVAYGNGRFIAVASGSATGITSTDGVTWSSITLPSAATWKSLAYNTVSASWLVVASTANSAASSTNGINWTAATYSPDVGVNFIASTPNGLVSLKASSSVTIPVSTDGINWYSSGLTAATDWSGIVSNGSNLTVAISGYTTATTLANYSTDTVTWSASTLPSSQNWKAITYGNGTFVAVASSGGVSAATTNGINWTAGTLPAVQAWNTVAFGNGVFVTVSYTSGTKSAASTDGINWTLGVLPFTSLWGVVKYTSNIFTAMSSQHTKHAYSTNGINWLATGTLPSSSTWVSMAYNGTNTLVAVSGNSVASTAAAYSVDGYQWSAATLPSATWSDVAVNPISGAFAAVAGITTATTTGAFSTDGKTWSATVLPSSSTWSAVEYGNGYFITVAGAGTATLKSAYSADGSTWVATDMPSTNKWSDIAFGTVDTVNKFVAVSNDSNTSAVLTVS